MAKPFLAMIFAITAAELALPLLAQNLKSTKVNDVRLTVIDFRNSPLHEEFAASLRTNLAKHLPTKKIKHIFFVTCPLATRPLDDCVAEAIATNPTLLYATTTTLAITARRVAPSLPIIFSGTSDPRKVGLVNQLERPGDNLTGFVSYADTFIKRLEILRYSIPKLKSVAILVSPSQLVSKDAHDMQRTARLIDLSLHFVKVSENPSDQELSEIFCNRKYQAFDIPTSSLLRNNTKSITALLAQCNQPAIYMHPDFVKSGGLMSYGPDDFDYAEKAVEYIRRAMNTADIGDIPIEFSTKFTLSINLEAAKKLQKKLNPAILKRADLFL
jgi:putative tryptophan/tyrosine transport system substrate-binding protein